MIIVLKPGTSREQVEHFSADLEKRNGVKVNAWYGEHSTVLGLLGDTAGVDIEAIQANELVESVKRVQEPDKKSIRTTPSSIWDTAPPSAGDVWP